MLHARREHRLDQLLAVLHPASQAANGVFAPCDGVLALPDPPVLLLGLVLPLPDVDLALLDVQLTLLDVELAFVAVEANLRTSASRSSSTAVRAKSYSSSFTPSFNASFKAYFLHATQSYLCGTASPIACLAQRPGFTCNQLRSRSRGLNRHFQKSLRNMQRRVRTG